MVFKQAGSPYWSYKFMFKGQVYCKSTRQANHKEALKIEQARRTELAKGEVGIFEKKDIPTLEEFCEKYFEPRISATVGGFIKAKTWKDFYKTGINALLTYEPLASARLDEIDAELMGRFATWRRKQGDKGKAVNTVNSNLRVLRRVLNKAVEWHSPKKGIFFLDKAPAFDLLKGANKRDRVLTFKEEAAYLKKARANSALLADFVSVLFDTALRPEECHRLRWETIAWEDGLHGDRTLRVYHGKTDSARREVPMSPRVFEILQARWKVAGEPAEGWVWTNPETASGHIEPSTIKKLHTKACSESKVRRFVVYAARHTSLTRLGCSGCDAWTLARIAGHSKIQQSMTYVHSQHMESAGWWGEWWEGRKNRSAASDKIRYTKNQAQTTRE